MNVIIGSGFSGSVIAERIANVLNEKVLLIEQRNHIGGNCHDSYDANGILVHNYGPHIFHTDFEDVWNYLSNFTEWIPYKHKVLAHIDKQFVPLPFNFISIKKLFPSDETQLFINELLAHYEYGSKVSIMELKKSNSSKLKQLADFIYKKVFLNYTIKQWGITPDKIDPKVLSRVPIRISEKEGYFDDKYQGIPKEGYAKIFEKLLRQPNIKLILDKKMQEIVKLDHSNKNILFNGKVFNGKLIYTGAIDELFDFKFGKLPYRSLRFEKEFHHIQSYQDAAVVNYPNEYNFTRITEFKKLTMQKVNGTTIFKEYPKKCEENDIPYYPLFTDESKKQYQKYFEYAKQFKNLTLIGRLAEFKYYDMDDAIKRALDIFESLRIQ